MPRDKGQHKHDDPMGHSKSSSKRDVYSYTLLSQETKKISNNLTLHLKQLKKEEQTKPKLRRK